MRRTIIFAAALGIILIGLWGTFVLLLDETRLKGFVADQLSDGIGRKVEIVGSLSLSLFPLPRIEAERVLVGGPDGFGGPELLSADSMVLSLRVGPLVRGRLVPGQVSLKGATVSLDSDGRNGSTAGDLARIASNASRLAHGEISLEDVTIVVSGDRSRRAERVALQRIELSQFVMDRNAAFRFRGSIVDPPLVDDLHVDAELHVPSRPSEPVELRDLRIRGQLPASGLQASLEGQLRVDRNGVFGLQLADANLTVGGQSLELEASYRDADRPQLEFAATGTALDWPVLSAAWPVEGGTLRQVPLAIARRMDVAARIRLQGLGTGRLPLSHLHIDLRTESSGLGIEVTAGFPGGLVEAGGVISSEPPDELSVDITLADTAALLEAVSLPPVIDASGEAQLKLRWPAGREDSLLLEGPFRLFDGRWEVVDEDDSPQTLAFDELSGQLLLQAGHLDLPALSISGDALDAVGWAAVDLSSGAVGGQLQDREDGGTVLLAGDLAQTLFMRGESAEDPGVRPSEGLQEAGESGPGQGEARP